MDDVNKKKPMEFWLHLRVASGRQNGFVVTLLLIHLISMAWCDWSDNQRLPPASDQSWRRLSNVTPFDEYRWQHMTVARVPAAAAIRLTSTTSTLDNRINVNDQTYRHAYNATWSKDTKRKVQLFTEQVYSHAVHRNAVNTANGSDANGRQLRWQSVTKQRPNRIDQYSRIPKKNTPNLLTTNQFRTNSVSETVRTNTVRFSDYGHVNHETDTVEFKVKSLRRNCALCRITPGQPIRAKPLFPAFRDCHCNPHGSLTQTCHKQSGQCTCRPHVIGRICDRCADGFWQLESGVGCHSCACNALGSQTLNCSAYTGQCNCKPGVGGLTCDSCLDGFYGLSATGCKRCDPCANSAYNCDPTTGRCICPPHTKGIECNQCLPNSYDWQHRRGCKLCDCDHTGAIGQACDLYTGQCMCREGFTGRRCDRCARGYFDFPRCERCNCNRAGSLPTNGSEAIGCDDGGQCACKALVMGLKCDACVASTFGLSPTNVDGCTRCHCFGRATQCVQSALSWGLIRAGDERHLCVEYQNVEFVAIQTMSNELAESYDDNLHSVNSLVVVPNTKGNVSIGSLHGFEVPLYFEMPPQFLGDRLLSYAGHFVYGIEMKECKTELDRTIIERFPLIQMHSHDSIILEYFGPEVYNINPNTTYSVRFTEQHWRLKATGEWITRDLFMMSLQNITRLFVRGTTAVAFTSLKLHNVTLETAIFLSGSTNNLAIGIEQCQCPSMYNGTSCQDPARGYYRYKSESWNDSERFTIERYVGQASPCDCNGRSNECDIETGYCQRCSNNSGGGRCEKCAEGFYGHPDEVGCESCPCPETRRNFAKGCSFAHGRVSCLCKPGYVGDFCDKCDSGYYGNPEAEDGICNGCECNAAGALSNECDAASGACRCREGFSGQRCDQCDSARTIIQGGRCEVCDNCTMTLLDSTEYLAYLIESEPDLMEMDGIPAPWPRLRALENSTQHLSYRLNSLLIAREKLDGFSDLQVDKLTSKSQNIDARWKKLQTKAHKRSEASSMLDIDALLIFAEITSIRNSTQATVDQLNEFGVTSHHVNVSLALREAHDLRQAIMGIAHDHNGAHRADQCAETVLEEWSNTSMILQSQWEETSQLKVDTENVKNRLYDFIQNVYKTSETLSNASAIHANNKHGYDRVNKQLSDITNMRLAINGIYNSSVIPQTDIILNMIDDGHGQIRQDLVDIVQLRGFVEESNAECAQRMNRIRAEVLPFVQNYSSSLMGRARHYVEMFQDTKNSAKIAMLASTAYKNISDAIAAAQAHVNDARQWAHEGKEYMYPTHGDSILDKSLKSFNRSKKIHRNALKDNAKLEDLEFLVKSQKRKTDAINNTMWQTGIRNNDILSQLNTFSKNDNQDLLKQAIDCSKNYSEQMREVRRGAVAVMSSDVYKLKLKLASLEPQWAVKFGMAEENVSQSLHNIKDIKNTLTSIEATSNRNQEKFQKWNQTMSVMMQDLRDKIAKARHIAAGIRVSMESKGVKCVRSYVPPTFGLSTANTIKLSVALNSKATTSPILYLQGNDNRFLAIEMVKRKIRFAWNLGGDTASVTHPMELFKKDLEFDEAWYQIEANRTMNVGSLIVRHLGIHANRSVPMSSAASQLEFTKIVLTPSNKLWIGRIPDEIYSSESGLSHDNELSVVVSNLQVDGKPVGLWNFVNSDGDCDGAMYGATDIRASNVRHFNGEGYSAVRKERFRPYKKNFFALQMSFKTLDENALLFLAVDEKNNRSISLTLHGGRIVFRIDYGGESKLEIITANQYNIGQWTTVEAAREFTSKRSTEIGSLKVGSEAPTIASPTTPITSNSLPDLAKVVYYLGGIPPGYRSAITIAPGAEHAYLGCMKDIQINGETYDPLDTSLRHGVEATCKETITRAGFNAAGYMELPNQSLRKRANIGFVFQTLQPDALLILAGTPRHELANNYYDEKDVRANYSISLTNGRLHFWVHSGRDRIEMVSNNTLNDGEYHTVNVIKAHRKFELRVDDEFQTSKSLTSQPFSINMIEDAGGFFVGGIPPSAEYIDLTAKLQPLRGTIKDLVVNNQTISFGNTVNHTRVEIGRNGPTMGNPKLSSELLMKTEPISKSFTAVGEGCHRAGAYAYEANAFKFGDRPQSYSMLSIGRHFWQNNFDIQFDFRTFYPNGLLFLIPGAKDKPKHSFTLNLRNGQLNVIARGRKRIDTVLSPKLNDGQWQRVSLVHHKKQLTIRVQNVADAAGQWTEQMMKLPRRISTSNMMYVGGIIDSMHSLSFEQTSKLEQFKGCIRRFYVNTVSQDLASPGRHIGINQCFPLVEKGSYFGGDAYAIYKRNFQVGKYLELRFEFRTSEVNGVILSVAEPNGFPAISIELHKGKILMSCDLGDGIPFRVESNLSSKYALCDNRWHNVSAFYDANQIAIRVDNLPSVNQFKQHETNGKVHTKSPLYIGGLPETAASGTLLSRENFKGCIRNVVIRNELKDWTDMDELQNVLLSECIAMS